MLSFHTFINFFLYKKWIRHYALTNGIRLINNENISYLQYTILKIKKCFMKRLLASAYSSFWLWLKSFYFFLNFFLQLNISLRKMCTLLFKYHGFVFVWYTIKRLQQSSGWYSKQRGFVVVKGSVTIMQWVSNYLDRVSKTDISWEI